MKRTKAAGEALSRSIMELERWLMKTEEENARLRELLRKSIALLEGKEYIDGGQLYLDIEAALEHGEKV